jgi:prepilin-type N-terminal cleavage/methylation domain-containing protein
VDNVHPTNQTGNAMQPNAHTQPKTQRGFTLIELVVVLVVLSLLAAVAVPKFIEVTKQAEASSVRGVLGNLRSALSLRMAQGLINGEDLAKWSSSGTGSESDDPLYPMQDLLIDRPEQYLGVIPNSDNRGAWYDDENTHEVVYVLKNDDIVDNASGESPRKLRYRIERVNADGEISNTGETAGLILVPRGNYDWNY